MLPDSHEFREISAFVVGDTIHRWGDELPVTRVENDPSGKTKLFYLDTDNVEKCIEDEPQKRYIAKKRTQSAT